MYLSMDGRWLRASNYSCERFPTLLPFLSADVVTNERTILKTFICHNTEFAMFQQPESAGCSSFVRACNLCVPERTGCGCATTGTLSSGFSGDARTQALAPLLAAASTLVVVLGVWLRRQAEGSYDPLLPLEGDSEEPVAAKNISVPTCVHWTAVGALVLYVVGGSVLVHKAEGHPHTPDLSQSAYAWILTGVFLARAAAFSFHRFAWGQLLETTAESTAVLLWLMPSALVVGHRADDEDPQPNPVTTMALGILLAIWVFVERVAALRLQQSERALPAIALSVVHAVAFGLRLVVWWRVSCE